MLDDKKIVILGATADGAEPAYQAVRAYLERGYKVFPVSSREERVLGLRCFRSPAEIHEIVPLAAVYVSPAEALAQIVALRDLGVRKVLFHPASANGRLILIAQGHQMDAEVVDAVKALSLAPQGA